MKNKFSIRYKFLLVITSLLVFCVVMYVLMATSTFKQDKTEMVFDYNRSLVTNIASDIESLFQSISDKMELAAHFLQINKKKDVELIRNLVAENHHIVFMAVSYQFKNIDKTFYSRDRFYETYGQDEEAFLREVKSSSLPFEKILTNGEAIWSFSGKNLPPLIGYGKSVVEEDKKGRPIRQFAVISYIAVDKILQSISRESLSQIYIVNSDADLLAHPAQLGKEEKHGYVREVVSEFIKVGRAQNVRASVVNLTVSGQEILGAFAKTFNNHILVISQVPSQKAFAVVNGLLYRSLLFASIVLTLAFLAAVLLSRSLTRPIEALALGMKKVSGGDLQAHISIETKDEINVLASSFNSMIDDLRTSRFKLEEVNRHLEDKVKERTAQLEKQNQAVKSAQEALLRTSRLAAIGEIAGRAAHEVLNPLTNIMNRAEKVREKVENSDELNLLRDIANGWTGDLKSGGIQGLIEEWKKPSAIDPTQSLLEEDIENLQQIEKEFSERSSQLCVDIEFLLSEGYRINRIVQSMRSLAVVSNEIKSYDVNQLLNEAIQIMADLASKEDVDIEFSYGEEIYVDVDYDEFIQSMTNMIRNSIQAIAEQKKSESSLRGLIRLETSVKNQKVFISITDNGTGIAEELAENLFDQQISTKPRSEGTGLGLNICRRFIRSFGGDIYLERSKVREGAEFIIELPIGRQQQSRSA